LLSHFVDVGAIVFAPGAAVNAHSRRPGGTNGGDAMRAGEPG
jgi:hypothetical protein